jgi:hypothetical protein
MAMADCDVCGVSMQSPCAIICLHDCSVCWCTVVAPEYEHGAADAPVAQIKLKGDGAVPQIDAKTSFRICTSGVSMAHVAALIDHLHPTASVGVPQTPPQSRGGILVGTLDELVAQIGLVSQPA